MKNLKILRKNSGLTLAELSKRLGISIQMLSYYELDQANPPLETIIRLADFFNCSADYLIGHQMRDSTQALPLNKKQLINDILKFDDADFGRVEAYVEGIKAARQEEEKIKRRFQQGEEA